MNREEIQNKALEALMDKKRASINVSMGVGKTLIGLRHIEAMFNHPSYLEGEYYINGRHYKQKFLVVVPKLSVKKAWLDDMKKFKFMYKSMVDFTTYIGLKNKNPKYYHTVYLDECHSITPNNYPWLYKYCKEYSGRIVGLTGTYPKTGVKAQLCNGFCPCVYSYTPDDAVNDGILNHYKIIVHLLPLDERKNREKKNKEGKTFMSSEKLDYQYWDSICSDYYKSDSERMRDAIMRMKVLQSFASKERYAKNLYEEQKDKTILFATSTAQANRIDKHSYHSKNIRSEKNLTDFKEGKINKLTCVEQLNEGVTIPGLKVGIIMHSFSNNRKSAQKIGRLLRLSANDTSTIHILCYENTVDERWVRNALADFEQENITYKKAKFYGN